jgi:hypothetical protein
MEEFKVQKLVWESVQMSRGKEAQGKSTTITGLIQDAIEAHKQPSLLSSKDPKKALFLLEEALEIGGKVDGDMSTSMVEAIRFVIKQSTTKAIDFRMQLADKVEKADQSAQYNPSVDERLQLALLIASCDIEDVKLEKSVRRLLRLPLPHVPGDPVTGKRSNSSSAGGSRMGDKVSKKTSSRTRGSSVGSGVSGSKINSSLVRQLPPPVDSLGPAATSTHIRSDMPPSEKGHRAAAKVRTLASERIDVSWNALKAEFEVQKMVWESLNLQKKVDQSKVADAQKASNLQTTIEGAMATRVKNPTLALRSMEQLLQQEGSKELLNNGMNKAVRNVVDQAAMIADRMQLAERLSTAGVPATLPIRPADKRQVEALVVACRLENSKLEKTVRELLLLSVPVDLGAPASGTPVSQKMSGTSVTQKASNVSTMSKSSGAGTSLRSGLGPGASKKTSGKRPHSTGAIKANTQNRPIAERIREDRAELPFEPPKREFLEL